MREILLSFIVRRAICNLTPKNYNKLFLATVTDLNEHGWGVAQLTSFFQRQTAGSARWPRDDEFQRHWTSAPTYTQLGPARSRAVLEELKKAKRTRFHETDTLKSGLTVEHVLPERWTTNWSMEDGTRPTPTGVNQAAYSVNEDDSSLGRIVRRNRLKHNIGNLTLLTQPMNSAQSNSSWPEKRALMQDPGRGSLLVLNKEINAAEAWDEAAIEARSVALFGPAASIWPYEAAARGLGAAIDPRRQRSP